MRLSIDEQIPPGVRRCAAEHQLGRPRIRYAAHKPARFLFIMGPLALLIGSAILVLYVLYYERVFSWWPEWQAYIVLAIGLAWLIVGCWICLTPLISPHIQVFLCPQGLIYRNGGRLSVIPWQRLARVWKTLTIDKKNTIICSYTVQRDDGARFLLKEDLPHLDRLGVFLEREVTRRHLPRALALYKAGQAQDFLEIEVNPKGLLLKREQKLLAWPDVKRVDIDKATMTIYRLGDGWEWASLSLIGIPNVGVLKGLADCILQELRIPNSPVIQTYDAGFPVHFGGISITKAGMKVTGGETTLPWREIASVGLGESEILIRRRNHPDQWFTLPIWMINDLPTLKELLDYILAQPH